ncbi:hypothetical protein XELAEV_18024956mg [Xenopus laevis]|uniref:Uncharacterized protein n=1 Tax=Xenopus laevis TaxID=8355 RepID=A0A974HLE0_XENLA|nr:hypothetical protein XELAEV_18024956mg [Xenopus laevis]
MHSREGGKGIDLKVPVPSPKPSGDFCWRQEGVLSQSCSDLYVVHGAKKKEQLAALHHNYSTFSRSSPGRPFWGRRMISPRSGSAQRICGARRTLAAPSPKKSRARASHSRQQEQQKNDMCHLSNGSCQTTREEKSTVSCNVVFPLCSTADFTRNRKSVQFGGGSAGGDKESLTL